MKTKGWTYPADQGARPVHLAGRRPALGSWADAACVAGLLLATACLLGSWFNASAHPYEDAAMLMRYAAHVAEGHGIVWNVGEQPVEGATDFLFMVLVALLSRAGLSVETATRAVGLLSHVATLVLVYFALTRIRMAHRPLAFLCAAYFAVSPGLKYIEAYFGTPFFALTACVSWCFAHKLLKERPGRGASLLFALSALVMGLARPEGVFLGALMALALLFARGFRASRSILLDYAAVMLVLGGAYFIWRWTYFGYPLPNPFYKKGGGWLYPASLGSSLAYAVVLCLPLALPLAAGLRSREAARYALFSLIPIAGFTLLWVLLSDEMNYLMRFQYPVLPLALISWPPLLNTLAEDLKLPRLTDLARGNVIALKAAALIFSAIMLGYPLLCQFVLSYRYSAVRDGRYDVACMLRDYADKGYAMVTTEAGLLPYYSGWRAVDSWGLNDVWIAHHGAVTEEHIERLKPHLLVFHTFFSPLTPVLADDPWSRMVKVLQRYAEKNRYRLAAVFGKTPFDTHYYYVRPGFADSAEIASKIAKTPYAWFKDGRDTVNFAELEWRAAGREAHGAGP